VSDVTFKEKLKAFKKKAGKLGEKIGKAQDKAKSISEGLDKSVEYGMGMTQGAFEDKKEKRKTPALDQKKKKPPDMMKGFREVGQPFGKKSKKSKKKKKDPFSLF